MRSARQTKLGTLTRRKLVAFVRFGALVMLAAGTTAGCGGAAPTASKSTPASKPSSSAAARASVSPPPSGLPAMASMPPPGAAGSKKARTKIDGALFTCGGGATSSVKDPSVFVKKLTDTCAAAVKMKPLGAMVRAQQADRDSHQEHTLRVEANKCYRVVFATDDTIRDAVVVMRDSAGDVVAESPGAALPEGGPVCFTTSDEVTLLFAVGTGKGSYALQVWSD